MEPAKEEAQPHFKPSLEPVPDPEPASPSSSSSPAVVNGVNTYTDHSHDNDNDNDNDNNVNVNDGTDPSQPDSPTGPKSKQRPISGVTPPYWGRHYRDASRTSQASSLNRCPVITLEDHTEDPNSDTNRGLWAKSVSVDDYVIIGGRTGIGAYVVWNCRIQTLEGGPMTIRMRYSEFDDLRQRLLVAFPYSKNALPPLPPKSVFYRFRRSFLESRRVGLEYFLNCVLLNPEFSGSPIVKDFLFGRWSR